MRAWLGWIGAALIAAGAVYLLSERVQRRLDHPAADAKIGQPAPDFRGDFAVNGSPVSLSELRGKVVLVDFWAVWCGPCIAAFPHLRDWHRQFNGDGLVIVGIADHEPRTEPAKLKAFAAAHRLEHLLMTMERENHERTCRAYGVSPIPHVVLIDRQGIFRAQFVGNRPTTADEIEANIKKLLAER